MDIIEKNKLIAEFMGYEKNQLFLAFNILEQGPTLYKDLRFHNSWDWLMPVIVKMNLIFENGIEQERGRVLWEEIHDMLSKLNIERTWLAVVEFITWYNNQK